MRCRAFATLVAFIVLIGAGNAHAGLRVLSTGLVSPDGQQPVTAVNAAGSGIVAFFGPAVVGDPSYPGSVQAARVTPDHGVGPVVTLSAAPTTKVYPWGLVVGIGNDGIGVVAWREGNVLLASFLTPGNVPTPPQTISSSMWTYGGPPRLAVDERGDAALAWVQEDKRPVVAVRPAGTTAFQTQWKAASPSLSGLGPQPVDVALDPSTGRITVAFARANTYFQPYSDTVEVAQAPFGGDFGAPNDVLTDQRVFMASVRAGANGDVFIAASHAANDGSGGGEHLSAAVSPDGRGALQDFGSSGRFFSPAIAPNGLGLIASVFQDLPANTDSLDLHAAAPDGSVARQRIATEHWASRSVAIDRPSPAFDPVGQPLLAYNRDLSQPRNGQRVGALQVTAHDPATGGWCPPQTIAAPVTPGYEAPLALNASGEGLLAWEDAPRGIHAATVASTPGCANSALSDLAVSPVAQVSPSAKSSLLGLVCRARCNSRVELLDDKDRTLAATRVRFDVHGGSVVRLSLTPHGRALLRRKRQLAAVASVTNAGRRPPVRSRVLLAR